MSLLPFSPFFSESTFLGVCIQIPVKHRKFWCQKHSSSLLSIGQKLWRQKILLSTTRRVKLLLVAALAYGFRVEWLPRYAICPTGSYKDPCRTRQYLDVKLAMLEGANDLKKTSQTLPWRILRLKKYKFVFFGRGSSRKNFGNFNTMNIKFGIVGNGNLGGVGVRLQFLKRWAKTAH